MQDLVSKKFCKKFFPKICPSGWELATLVQAFFAFRAAAEIQAFQRCSESETRNQDEIFFCCSGKDKEGTGLSVQQEEEAWANKIN